METPKTSIEAVGMQIATKVKAGVELQGKYRILVFAENQQEKDDASTLFVESKLKGYISFMHPKDKELRDALAAVRKKYLTKLSEFLGHLEKETIAEMKEDLKVISQNHLHRAKLLTESRIEDTAEMFVTNQIIDIGISNDASGDWDGGPRADDLYEYMIENYEGEEYED